jgi:hypothetical protein
MKQIGILDLGIQDIISLLERDPVLKSLPTFPSLWEVDANTRKPCQSVDLDVEEDGSDGGSSGGCVDEYESTGAVIQYLEPDHAKELIMPDLNEYRERTRNIFKESVQHDWFETLESVKYIRSKPMPWVVQGREGPKVLAHRMITDFTATYSVKEEV